MSTPVDRLDRIKKLNLPRGNKSCLHRLVPALPNRPVPYPPTGWVWFRETKNDNYGVRSYAAEFEDGTEVHGSITEMGFAMKGTDPHHMFSTFLKNLAYQRWAGRIHWYAPEGWRE